MSSGFNSILFFNLTRSVFKLILASKIFKIFVLKFPVRIVLILVANNKSGIKISSVSKSSTINSKFLEDLLKLRKISPVFFIFKSSKFIKYLFIKL